MKRSAGRYGTMSLLIGLVGLAGAPTDARQRTAIELLSAPFGIAFRQAVRITAAHLGIERDEEIIVQIQLLDTEGAVIAQSDPISVKRGEIRFWDAPRDVLPAGELSGRTQIRARLIMPGRIITTRVDTSPVEASVEIVDADTAATAFIEQMAVRQITLGCGGAAFCP